MGKKRRMKIDGRTYKVTLDKFLADKKLRRKCIAKDGSCLFRAVSEQVYASQCSHHEVRLKCAEYIGTHRDDFKEFITIPLDTYLDQLCVKKLWGGELELVVLSRLYNRSIVVYNELVSPGGMSVEEKVFPSIQDEEKNNCSVDELNNPIMLAYSDGNHYDSVYSTQYMEDTGFCQGLLYTLLAEKVFSDKIPFHCKRKLKQLQESDIDSIAKYKERQERQYIHPSKDPETRTLFNLSKYYGTDEVVAMSWTMHHNTALSLHRYEKESFEQRDRSVAASIQFSVGNKCHIHIDGKRLNGEIAALNVSPGMHLVYVLHKSEKWEIPVKNLTLISSQLPTGNRKSQSSGVLGTNGVRVGGSGRRERAVFEAVCETPPTTSQSVFGPVASTTASSSSLAPSGSVKKGKVVTSAVHAQKGNLDAASFKKRRGSGGRGSPAESAPLQANVKSATVTPSKGEPNKSALTPPSAPRVPVAAGTAQLDSTKMTPYSSIVKKTSGGPSGSLTSEGTEYDESSAEEEAHDASETSNKFPQQQLQQQPQQQQQQQQGELKVCAPPSTAGQGDGDLSAVEPASEQHIISFQQSGSVTYSKNHLDACMSSPTLRQPEQDSPYFDRHPPLQRPSSEPEDAWPSIHEEHKEVPSKPPSIPQTQGMIYAAVMSTNRSNQNQDLPPPPTTTSSPTPHQFPYSATTATRQSAFPAPFSSRHAVVATMPHPTPLPHPPPQVPAMYRQQPPVQSIGMGGGGVESMLKGGTGLPILAGHPTTTTRVTPTQSVRHFQSNQLPPTPPAPLMSPAAYASPHHHHHQQQAPHPQARMAAGSQLFAGAGGPLGRGDVLTPHMGYTSGRSPRASENLGAVASTTTPPLPYSTIAAGREMRNILGIQGGGGVGVQSTTSIYTNSSITAYQRSPPARLVVVTAEKEVQECPDVAATSVQTVTHETEDSVVQTSGVYVPVEDISPSREVQVDSLADRLNFAVEYSLQCLSVFAQATSTSFPELEASLKELLEDNQLQQLVDQAARVSNLSASQNEFLKSMGASGEPVGPMLMYPQASYGDGQSPPPPPNQQVPASPMGGDSPVDVGRNENMPPQQEQQHLQSPPLPPRMPLNFPFMMPPRPPPPFMVPHHPPPPPHGNMPMYYHPFMTHMPVPHMGYMPFMPQMIPRQVGPPASPRREVSPTEHNPSYGTPDNAHQDIPVQDQVQPADAELNVEPSHPTNHPLTDVPSSEMVASLSYPLPPSAMVQPHFPDPPPPTATLPAAAGGANDGDVASGNQVADLPALPQQQNVMSLPHSAIQQPQQQQDGSGTVPPPNMVMAVGDSGNANPNPNPVATMGKGGASASADVASLLNSKPPQLSTTPQQSTSPLHSKQQAQHAAVATPPQHSLHSKQAQASVSTPHNLSSSSSSHSRPHKPSKGSTMTTTPNTANPGVSEGPPTPAAEGATHPGLPCRSLPTSTGGGGSLQQSKQHSGSKHAHHNKTRPKGDGEAFRRSTTKSKPSTYRTSRKEEQVDEKSPAGGGDGAGDSKRETSSKKVNYRGGGGGGGSGGGGRKRPPNSTGSHAGTSAVSGPSSKPNQDPSRTFPRSRSNCSSTSDGGRDTKDFRWGVPSPSDTLDTENSFPQRTPTLPMNAAAESEPGKTEWPDFPELNGAVPSVVASRETFSSTLEFTTPLVEGRRRQQPWGGEGGGSVEDDMFLADPPPPRTSGGDLRGYPLTLSPSQRSPPISLAQCTGDLAHHGTANLHKH